MNIERIAVIINRPGTDYVSMKTDFPSPFPPGISNDELSVSFEVEADKGVEYVKENFPNIPTTVIDYKTGARSEAQ